MKHIFAPRRQTHVGARGAGGTALPAYVDGVSVTFGSSGLGK
jgi:hypothetical protein